MEPLGWIVIYWLDHDPAWLELDWPWSSVEDSQALWATGWSVVLSGKPTNYIWLATILGYRPSAPQTQVPQLVRDYPSLPQDLLEKTFFRREPKLTAVKLLDKFI